MFFIPIYIPEREKKGLIGMCVWETESENFRLRSRPPKMPRAFFVLEVKYLYKKRQRRAYYRFCLSHECFKLKSIKQKDVGKCGGGGRQKKCLRRRANETGFSECVGLSSFSLLRPLVHPHDVDRLRFPKRPEINLRSTF